MTTGNRRGDPSMRQTEQPEDGDAWIFGRPLHLALGTYLVVGGAVGLVATSLSLAEQYHLARLAVTSRAIALWLASLLPFATSAYAGTALSREEASGRALAMIACAVQAIGFSAGNATWLCVIGAHAGVSIVSGSLEWSTGWGTYVTVGARTGPPFVYVNIVALGLLAALWRLPAFDVSSDGVRARRI